jgi:molybdate transport system substrate-binding protein
VSGPRRAGALALVTLALAVASACGDDQATSAGPMGITVAAASDLRPAFEELGAEFTAQTGIPVTFSFGSSGQLREQILNGAPFDLFASANVEYVDQVVAAGRGIAETQVDYAYGRIVLWSPPGVPLPAAVEDLVAPGYRRIAIANPEHAPYGRAAREALEAAGVWSQVQERLVYGENVSDALRIASSGNADVGIVALSLAIAAGSPYTLVPAELHEPLRQALVVTSTGATGAPARRFAELVSSPAGRAVMARYGFVLPGEAAEPDR